MITLWCMDRLRKPRKNKAKMTFACLKKSANNVFDNTSQRQCYSYSPIWAHLSLWFGTYCLRMSVGGWTEAFIVLVGLNISSLKKLFVFLVNIIQQGYWPAQWQWGWHAHGWWTDHWTAESHNSYGRPHTPDPGAERHIPLQKQKGKKWIKASQAIQTIITGNMGNFSCYMTKSLSVNHNNKNVSHL